MIGDPMGALRPHIHSALHLSLWGGGSGGIRGVDGVRRRGQRAGLRDPPHLRGGGARTTRSGLPEGSRAVPRPGGEDLVNGPEANQRWRPGVPTHPEAAQREGRWGMSAVECASLAPGQGPGVRRWQLLAGPVWVVEEGASSSRGPPHPGHGRQERDQRTPRLHGAWSGRRGSCPGRKAERTRDICQRWMAVQRLGDPVLGSPVSRLHLLLFVHSYTIC